MIDLERFKVSWADEKYIKKAVDIEDQTKEPSIIVLSIKITTFQNLLRVKFANADTETNKPWENIQNTGNLDRSGTY